MSTQISVIVHMITSGMSACDPHREKRPRLCAWAGCQRGGRSILTAYSPPAPTAINQPI